MRGHLFWGGGTVSPTALSETNSTDGVYSSRVDGSHELRCTGGIFTDTQNTTYNNAIYVVNQNSAPAAKLKFTPPDGHSIVAWRIDMGTAWGYNDAINSKVQMLLKAANLKCSADNTELTFTCPGSITYGGETYPAFVADASLTPVLNITAADLLFEKGTIVLGNELSSGSGITATLVYYSVTDGVKGSEAMTTRPTKPGQYQIAVRLSVDGASATDKYANRVKCGNVYYQVDPSQELTSEKWRYRVVSSSVNLTVDENGEPVVPSGTAGVSYADGVLTIYPRFVVHFGVNDIVKCDIVNEGKLDGGIFTGTVTNKGVIESGMFVNKPENAASAKFSFTSGTAFCGLKDPSGTTSLYIVCTGKGSHPQLSASYSNPNRTAAGWLVAVTSPSFKGTNYGSMMTDNWTLVSSISTALSEQLYDAVAVYTPVAYMDSSDLSIDSTGTVNISIPEVEATGVTYTNKATNETFTSYPTVAGDYVAKVSLKCKRNWDSLTSQSPVIPASALLADDGVAALSEEQENPLRRIALKGDLYYYVPETLEVEVTVELPTVPPTDGDGNVTFEGTDEVKGDGWTAKKDDEGKTTVEITDGKNLNNTTLNCNKITIGSEGTSTTVSNLTTSADVTVASGSAIEGGTFSGNVSGTGTIEGGTFTGTVDSSVTVTGGVFTEKAAENLNAQTTPVTVTGGASINNIKNESGSEDNKTTVQVVGEPQLSLAYTPDEGRTFYGWQKDADIIVKGEKTKNTNVTVDSNDSEPVYTPVVKLIKDDLVDFNLTEVAGTEGYYQVVDGELTGDCLGNELPTEPGTYALGVKLANAESTENTIALALYADETASVGNIVLMKDGVGYYVPEVLAIGNTETVYDPDAATGSGDSGAGGAAVAVIGGAAIGGAAYLIGTQVYLTSVLPEGASIPTNRQQLADLLWTAAGKPQPASTALFTDISAEAADSQKAARWCVEQGLLKDTGSTFKPDKHTFRPQVIKAWNDLQAKLNPQK